MKVIRDKDYYYVVFEGRRIYKSHIELDCEQWIFAKSIERRWSK